MLASIATLFVLAVVAPAGAARWGRRVLALLAVVPAAIAVWVGTLLPGLARGEIHDVVLGWVPQLGLTLDLRMDMLAAVFTLVVCVVGAAVLAYSVRYFPSGDDGLPKYAGSLVAFAAAMLLLVLADNLILLQIAWEATAILSYLLIAHRVRRQPSRVAAMQSLMVTTAGGLAMLVGVVLLGVQTGTFRLSEIIADPPAGAAAAVAVVLIVIGGISKSAIVPFHFWLPGAMAAPTPASAYLHAATMVKAGIYLFLRLSPLLAVTDLLRPALVIAGAVTMIGAGAVALAQRDLKLLLAYGTVSQLGLLTLLIGNGRPAALAAALALVVAHALFKASLFFVIGIIDTSTGTRDLTELSGLGRRMPGVAALAALAGLSMVGLPPTVGFVAKETGYEALLADGAGGAATAAAMAVGSLMTVAYTVRLLWGAFAVKDGVEPLDPAPRSVWMLGPTVVFVAAGIVLGVVPGGLDRLIGVGSAPGAEVPAGTLAAWHGLGIPLLLTTVTAVGGVAIFAVQRMIERRRERFSVPSGIAGFGYRAAVNGLHRVAASVTAGTQRGSLPVSLGAILVVLLAFPGGVVVGSGLLRDGFAAGNTVLAGSLPQALLAMVAAGLALTVTRIRYALAAVLTVGGVGYSVAILFVLRGAPDLALTQILVETVTLVVAVLVIVRMPASRMWVVRKGALARTVRIALAAMVGGLMFALALILPGMREATPVSSGLAARAVAEGGGRNVVNVILVDVRGWDTFGEISVLVAAAVGVSSLIFLRNPWMDRRRLRTTPGLAPPIAPDPSPWLATDAAPRRSLLLEVATRLVFHLIIIFSLYVLFVGHDEPGGGFAGGLIAGIALALRYLAGGRYELMEAAPIDAGVVMGTGLGLAAITAGAGLVTGGDALSSVVLTATVPLLGDLRLVTSTFFDIGVYLVVVGIGLEILRSLGAELDRQSVQQDSAALTARSGRGVVS